MVLVGAIVGFIGLALLLMAVWIIISLGFAIEDAVDDEAEAVGTPATGA